MTSPTGKVLAIGLDAGDQDFIRDHLADLPHIGRFFSDTIVHPLTAEPLSGSVWSSFVTCAKPGVHGVYHHMQWNPDRMRVQRTHPNWVGDITPFWRDLANSGKRITVLDVPFVFEGDSGGALEIFNWGSHDLVGPFWSSDPSEVKHIKRHFGAHPMGFEVPVQKSVRKLAADRDRMIEGAALRARLVRDLMSRRPWDLFIVAFGETHRAGHLLHPTPGEEHMVPAGAFLEVYKAVDRAVGEILQQAGPGCDVVLFALHGMAPNSSQSHLTRGMLDAAMRTAPGGGADATAKTGLVRWLRQTVPAKLQHMIASAVPTAVRDFVVAREIAGGVSRGTTKAISLDGDLSGYWRLMKTGRESIGVLTNGEAEALTEELATAFSTFTAPDGRPLVKKMHFPAAELSGARARLLPDLVAEWDLDLAPQTEARHPELETVHGQLATGRGGNHRFNGFFAHIGPRQGRSPAPAHISELGMLIEALAK